jgi:hypothetical protein
MSSHALFVHDTTATPPATHELHLFGSGDTMVLAQMLGKIGPTDTVVTNALSRHPAASIVAINGCIGIWGYLAEPLGILESDVISTLLCRS